jgi:hypothetical protein
MTLRDIWLAMVEAAGKHTYTNFNRPVVGLPVDSAYGRIGYISLALRGTPARAYARLVKQSQDKWDIFIYNSFGTEKQHYSEVAVEELNGTDMEIRDQLVAFQDATEVVARKGAAID